MAFVRLEAIQRPSCIANQYLCIMKRFYPLTGFFISLFIGLLGYVMRSYREEISSSVSVVVGSFGNAFLGWLVVQ